MVTSPVGDLDKCRVYIKKLQTDEYVQQLHCKAVNPADIRPAFDPGLIGLIQSIELVAARTGNIHQVQKAIAENMDIPVFAGLCQEPKEQDVHSDNRARVEVADDPSAMPPLPEGVALPPEMSTGACPWHDEYVAFSKKWSPRSFANFHPAAGWSILSGITARRVVLHLGSAKYTPLFIAEVATSSLDAKTEMAKIYLNVLRRSGLDWLLGADSTTPQAMVQAMAIGTVPKEYVSLSSEEEKYLIRRDLAFQGQRAWFYEEFGQHMDAMMQKGGGPMAEFKGLIRRMDDCYPSYTRETIAHRKQTIEYPYLSLLACMTPMDLKPHAKADSPLWRDGFFARFAFITPDGHERNRDRFPAGNMEQSIPDELTKPLKSLHKRLGERKVDINHEINDKNGDVKYTAIYGDFPQYECTLGAGVIDAFYSYNNALLDIVGKDRLEQFAGNYARLHMIAMRIAMLCAALENRGRIEMRHWAKGQEFAEMARAGLHNLWAQLSENSYAQERNRLEENLIEYIQAKVKNWVTSRELRRKKFKDHTAESFDLILNSLVKSGDLMVKNKGKTRYYTTPEFEKLDLPAAQGE